jgi:hypothetical protein
LVCPFQQDDGANVQMGKGANGACHTGR